MTDLTAPNKTHTRIKYLIIAVALLLPLFYFFSPMVFQGMRPMGVDISASMGSNQLIRQYEKESGERALWNPNVFAGTPVYPRITPDIVHVDSLLKYLGEISYTYFWYFLAGALGVFFLLRYKKQPWYIALIAALAFMLLPHWIALLHTGHFAKLRAFMVIPWLILSFNYLIDKRSWLSVALFALCFSWITRTQHMQIVFYGILILIFLFFVPVVRLLIQKEWKQFADVALKILAGVVLTIAVSSQPFVSLEEYTEHSTRGGNAVQMQADSETSGQEKGVGLRYATNWSLDGKGLLAFVIPRYAGGLSQETYTGNKYPQLKGRAIPGYWGEMPFTQSYDFVGILLFLLAVTGAVLNWKKEAFIRCLSIFSVFAILLAFGRHFMPLYRVLYEIVPYFSKFRVPSMIVNMVFIAIIIMAAYGLRSLLEEESKKYIKQIAGIFGGAAVLLVLLLLLSNGFSYAREGEAARYGAQTMEIIRSIRKEYLQTDTLKALFFVLAGGGLLIARAFNKLKKVPVYLLLGLLITLELFTVANKAYKNMPMGHPETLERREFRQTDITRYLGQQPRNARVFAYGHDSNHYNYFYPGISGYSAIKLQTIQDLRDHCLYTGNGLNWNVLNMLGGRYVILPGQMQEDFLQQVAVDENRREVLYVNHNALPKAWFVQNVRTFPEFRDMLHYMNAAVFDPASEALLKGDAAPGQTNFSASGSIRMTANTPNRMEFAVSTPDPQFAVFSEMYYPEGWVLTKNGETLPLIQTNYALRGATLPAGDYTLTMEFHPRAYYSGMNVVWIGNTIMILMILLSVFIDHREKLPRILSKIRKKE